MTPITQEAREAAIAKAVEAARNSDASEKKEIDFKGTKVLLPVARVHLDHVLLNHRSHRIGAQMQSLSEADTEAVRTAPFGQDAQKIIADVLRKTERFAALKRVLETEKQRDEGVLTTGGVLINANTRAVALRDLGESYIKVIVLPSDAGESEFNDIELSLQLARDHKQDYTLANELLFIEDLVNQGRSPEEIGRLLRADLPADAAGSREARKDVERSLRMLAAIREVIDLSGGARKFTDFDSNRQALIEIDADYEVDKNKDRVKADLVRDAQLAGMLVNIDYRQLRDIDHDVLSNYVPQVLEEDDVLGDLAGLLLGTDDEEESDDLPGLEFLDDDIDDVTGPSFRRLLTLIAGSGEDGEVNIPGADTPIKALALTSGIAGVFTEAIKAKRNDAAAGDSLTEPARLLTRAATAIDAARQQYEDVRRDPDFDVEAYVSAYERLERAMTMLIDDAAPDDTAS